jgi:hypothetical protein
MTVPLTRPLTRSLTRPATAQLGSFIPGNAINPRVIGVTQPGALTFSRSVNLILNAAKTRCYMGSTANTNFAIFNITSPYGGLPVVGSLADATNLPGANGVALSADERYAFVACEAGASVTVIDMVDEANPAVVLRFRGPTAGTSLAGASNIRRSGNILFVTTITRHSLALIDCTDPLNLVWLTEVRGPTPGTSLNTARDVEIDVANKLAYVASEGRDAITVVDWTTPASAAYVTEVRDTTALNAVRGVLIVGSKLYCGVADGVSAAPRGALTTLSLATPAAPVIENAVYGGGAFSDLTSMNGKRGLARYGNYLFTTGDNSLNLMVWSIANPAAPLLIGKTQGAVKGVDYNHPMGIRLMTFGGKVIALVTMFATNSLDNRGLIAVDTGVAA